MIVIPYFFVININTRIFISISNYNGRNQKNQRNHEYP